MTDPKKPLVTVAIPAYKTTFLKEAINSVLSQSYTNLEIIIVNDHSPNDVRGIVNQFEDKRISYYENQTNLGKDNPANNWNMCLRYAKGEFFCLLCDDDLYHSQFVSTMLTLADCNKECNVFRARACFIDREGKETDWYPSSPQFETTTDYMWHTFKGLRKQTISEFFYRTEHIRRHGGYALLPLAWYADYLSIFNFSTEGGIVSTYQTMVQFRLSGENISSQDDKNTITKIKATNLYVKEVIALLDSYHLNAQFHDTLVALLMYHTSTNTKWSLKHAPYGVLAELWLHHKQYQVKRSWVWNAIKHHN